jgi:hypothetical protein
LKSPIRKNIYHPTQQLLANANTNNNYNMVRLSISIKPPFPIGFADAGSSSGSASAPEQPKLKKTSKAHRATATAEDAKSSFAKATKKAPKGKAVASASASAPAKPYSYRGRAATTTMLSLATQTRAKPRSAEPMPSFEATADRPGAGAVFLCLKAPEKWDTGETSEIYRLLLSGTSPLRPVEFVGRSTTPLAEWHRLKKEWAFGKKDAKREIFAEILAAFAEWQREGPTDAAAAEAAATEAALTARAPAPPLAVAPEPSTSEAVEEYPALGR